MLSELINKFPGHSTNCNNTLKLLFTLKKNFFKRNLLKLSLQDRKAINGALKPCYIMKIMRFADFLRVQVHFWNTNVS